MASDVPQLCVCQRTNGGTKIRHSVALVHAGVEEEEEEGRSRSVGLSAVLNWVISENIAIATNVPSQASLDRDHIHMSQ